MSARATRGAAAGPLVHWLLLVIGLALLTFTRFDEPDLLPIGLGSVCGTAVGQLLARARLRMWLAMIVVGGAMWFFAALTTPLFWMRSVTFAWVPAMAASALSGYASLSERSGLLGLWYPAVLWMLPLLDGHLDRTLTDRRSAVLLTGLAVLVIFAMRAREARRVALWQTHATHALAPAPRRTTTRRAPLRAVVRPGWMAALCGGVALLAAWVAPELWRREEVATAHALAPSVSAIEGLPAAATGARAPCCPEAEPVDVHDERVSELLPVHPAPVDKPPPPAGCLACIAGSPIVRASTTGGSVGAAGAGGTVASSEGAGSTAESRPAPSPIAAPPHAGSATTPATSLAPPPREAPAPPEPTIAVTPTPPPGTSAASPIPPPSVPTRPHDRRASIGSAPDEPRPPGESTGNPFPALLALVAAAACLRLAIRALRRHVTLRHLVRPMWRVTVDQRVSNLWQLVLIGLRDAGWCTHPDEQPNALARRVGLADMASCATVLERARHGVRVDAADLASMERSAREVYRTARGRAGFVARVVAWLRWPL